MSVIVISVGVNGTLTFDPTEVTAALGDIVQFQFTAGNHSVVQGDFANPCAPTASSGFYSGFQPVAAALSSGNVPVFSILINETTPIAYYCAQARHCQAGMVGVINPSGSSDFANYKKAAASAASNLIPGATTSSTSSSSTTPTQSESLPPSSSSPPQTSSLATTSSQTTSSLASSTTNSDSGSSLSSATRTGIGIGVAVAAGAISILLAVVWCLLLRRRGRRQRAARGRGSMVLKPELEASTRWSGSAGAAAAGNGDNTPPLRDHAMSSRSVYELDGLPRSELVGDQRR